MENVIYIDGDKHRISYTPSFLWGKMFASLIAHTPHSTENRKRCGLCLLLGILNANLFKFCTTRSNRFSRSRRKKHFATY